MNTPALETERLILRRFSENDLEAIYRIFSDEEVNRFLPWFPLKSVEEARPFFEERYASKYAQPQAYAYAVCLKKDDIPIGYVNVDMAEHHDLGYGLRKEFWNQGIMTEAGKAVAAQVKKDGLLYITATHDRDNPRSAGVMKNIGEGGLLWSDPEIGVDWPIEPGMELIISDKDKKWSGLKDTFKF